MSARLADDELLITRIFDAPVELVFSMWSEVEHFRRWMGPDGFECVQAELDFRVGGAYRGNIRSAEHGDNPFQGVYREIEPNRRLVFTYAWTTGPSAGVETLVTITFAERGGKTVQTFHQSGFRNVASRDSHVGGWESAFSKEQAYVETTAKETSR
jgi:uncharacterized protein YndB with AHSA1/START domain